MPIKLNCASALYSNLQPIQTAPIASHGRIHIVHATHATTAGSRMQSGHQITTRRETWSLSSCISAAPNRRSQALPFIFNIRRATRNVG